MPAQNHSPVSGEIPADSGAGWLTVAKRELLEAVRAAILRFRNRYNRLSFVMFGLGMASTVFSVIWIEGQAGEEPIARFTLIFFCTLLFFSAFGRYARYLGNSFFYGIVGILETWELGSIPDHNQTRLAEIEALLSRDARSRGA